MQNRPPILSNNLTETEDKELLRQIGLMRGKDIPEVLSHNLIRNSIRTPDGTELISRHRHDYVSYTDVNGKEYVVDGGLDYLRRTIHSDQVETSLYDDQPHEVQREVITWGTYGASGTGELRYIPIKDMDTEHIHAVLKECNPSKVLRACMLRELEYRGDAL